MTYADWQQRVIDEKAALDTKIAALYDFTMDRTKMGALRPIDRHLLIQQHTEMTAYSQTLGLRISLFA